MEEFFEKGGLDSLLSILKRIERKVDHNRNNYMHEVSILEQKVYELDFKYENRLKEIDERIDQLVEG